jgi:U3 small nucleolar RNA-associated protein 22
LLDLDRRLTGAHENITTYLGRENRELGLENLAYLDVIYESGAAFRLRIFVDMEETLLDRQVKNKTLEPRVREQAEAALDRFKWQYEILPLHSQTIATYSTRFFALSQTTRLVKQWFNAQKLAGHFSEELIELFVLHVFLSPYPWKTPSSVTTGFLRTLDFLSRWDWREEPLVVDSAEELTVDDRLSVRKELESWRRRDPNMNNTVLLVATSHDQSGLAYTRNGPSRLAASRMTLLAKAACKLVRSKDHRLDASQLFQAALQDYDVLIHVSPKVARAVMRDAGVEIGASKAQSRFKNLDDRTGKIPLPVRAGPVEVLLAELQRVYEDTIIFFHGGLETLGVDGAGGDDQANVIGAIWNPRLQKQKFRAGLPYNFKSAASEDEDAGDVIAVNREAILLEIARIGGELIKKIEVVEESE